MNEPLLIAGILCGLVAIICFAIDASEDCPRQVLGYNCHEGNPNYPEGCDHSSDELARALRVMGRHSWPL